MSLHGVSPLCYCDSLRDRFPVDCTVIINTFIKQVAFGDKQGIQLCMSLLIRGPRDGGFQRFFF